MSLELAPYVTLGVVAAMFALFLWELFSPEVVAVLGLGALLGLGVIDANVALGAMANPAPATIACMFILSSALVRVGLLDLVSERLVEGARSRPVATIGVMAVFIGLSSAFVNNTPIVVMMIPIAIRLATEMRTSASRLLIPVSYCAILGGMCTMIGTSTNLIVDGVAQRAGLAPFSMFEIAPAGFFAAITGMLYLVVLGPHLLPDRPAPGGANTSRKALRFMTEVVVPEDSIVIGRPVADVEALQREDVTVMDVLRGDESLRRSIAEVRLMEGDRIIVLTGVTQLVHLRSSRGFKSVDRISQRSSVTLECLVAPGCKLIGRILGAARLRRRYGVYPLAMHRREPLAAGRLDDVLVRLGDTLMVEGSRDDIRRMTEDLGLVELTQPLARPYRRDHAPLVGGVFLGIVVLSAIGAAPIVTLAVIGVATVLAFGAIDVDEAFMAVDGRLLTLLLAMLGVGAGMEATGAVSLLANVLTPALQGVPPTLILWLTIAMASVLTEMVTNNAVAVVMTPVAIALAESTGVDPRPFVVGVMIAASASFATPIGYQTNMLIYAPGGYRFIDYIRVGAPLNLLVGVVAALTIPLFWAF